MTYTEKLKDPRWQKKRLEVLDSAGWTSNNCGEKTKHLQVHHTYYKRELMPWEYEGWSLVCLCEECHKGAQIQMEDCHRVLAIHPDLISAIAKLASFTSHETAAVTLLSICSVVNQSNHESFLLGQKCTK